MKRTNDFKNIGEFIWPIKKLVKSPKKNKYTAMVVVAVLVLILGFSMYSSNSAYAVKVNGNTVGIIREIEDFTMVIDSLKENYYKEHEAEMVFNEIVEYEKLRASDEELTTVAQMESSLRRSLNIKVKAYDIKANGKTVATVSSRAEAENVLEEIKKPYIDENIEDIYFGEKVTIDEISTEMKNIRSLEEIVKLIEQGTDEIKTHEVQAGESFWTIAEMYNLQVEDLEKANPDVRPERLQINQAISLIVPKPLLTVVTTRRERYEEAIPFEVEFEETSAIYKGETTIKTSGKNGKREVYAEIVTHNHIEVDRKILEEEILEKPRTQVVLKGTKEPPPRIGTGTFSNPTRGTLSSRYGSRWGRMHEGIDIAARTGTPVYAADGGKVIYSGTNGAYGKLVKIDHGGGFVTYYAHNSKLLVSKGEKVFKGQKIAEVGNTGRSTGPHLHFEVRKHGKTVNPLSYVKY